MVSQSPDERRTVALAVLTAVATTAATAAVNWLFSEAQRVVKARRAERAAQAAHAAASTDDEVAS